MRRFLKNSAIGVKLPILVGALVAATILISTVASDIMFRQVVVEAAQEKLEATARLKGKRIKALLLNIDRDLKLHTHASSVIGGMRDFSAAYGEFSAPKQDLQRIYVRENPHAAGERERLVDAQTGNSYGAVHSDLHPIMEELQKTMGYYDIFFIDKKGNVVYSVYKEADFGANIADPELKDSGLTEVFKKANANGPQDEPVVSDFAPYQPSAGQPASFIAMPVFDKAKNRLGVLVYQLPISALSAAAGDLEGIGHGVSGFIVGADGLLRTDVERTEENDILTVKIDNVAVHDGIAGNYGGFEATGLLGQQVMGYYTPIKFHGIKWVGVVQKDMSEVLNVVWTMLMKVAVVSLVILVAAVGLAIAMSRLISRPVQKLTTAVQSIADGAVETDVPGIDRGDEIGALAKATEIFRQNAIKVQKMSEKEHEAHEEMMRLNAEREKAAEREAKLAKEREDAEHQAAEEREAMMRDLGAAFGEVVRDAQAGRFTNRVKADFDDEVLVELARSMNDLMESVDHGLSSTGSVLARVADGDLTSRMDGEFQGAFGELQDNVNGMMDGLIRLIGGMSESGMTLSASAAELRQTSDTLARHSEQNAASVEQTSAALEEMSASVKQVSTDIKDVSDNAKEARNTATSSEQIAADAASAMDRIAEGSQEIARVIGVINEIAFQINLLALNAGVEAARAGEAGRGFSVVASEVRQLAERASAAALEIAEVISQSDQAVAEGVSKVAGAKTSLEDIAARVVNISERVDSVTIAISEQATGIDEISSAVNQIDSSTQQQAAGFEEVTASSHVLANEAEELKRSTGQFKIEGLAIEHEEPPVEEVAAEPVRVVHASHGSAAIASETHEKVEADWADF